VKVAVNKQTRDDRIKEVLEQLRKQYSPFKVLKEIHPTPKMKTFLTEAYKLGIDFARYATCYYLRSNLGKYLGHSLLLAVLKPTRQVMECD
jgi:hypothetical protein